MGIGFQLPALMNLASLDRLGVKAEYPILSLDTLKNMALYAFSNTTVGHEGNWGISSILLFAVVMLFLEKKKKLLVKCIFILYTISFGIPFFGSIFNGMSFPTGRYVFGYLFLCSYIVTLMYDRILQIKFKTMLYLTIGTIIYFIVALVFTDSVGFISGFSLMIVSAVLIFLSKKEWEFEKKHRLLMATLLLSCILISTFKKYCLSISS